MRKKSEDLEAVEKQLKGMRADLSEMEQQDVRGLRKDLSEVQATLEEMIELLKRALKSMDVLEEMGSIMTDLSDLGAAARSARKEMSDTGWKGRIRTSLWGATVMLVALILAMSILWSTTTLPRHLMPASLVLTDQEMEMLKRGRRYAEAFQGLTEEEQERVTSTLKEGLVRAEEQESR